MADRPHRPATIPRLLGFYRDVLNPEAAVMSAWEPICWGIEVAPGGAAFTIHVDGPPRVTAWRSVQEAIDSLDAFVDAVEPRRRWTAQEGDQC